MKRMWGLLAAAVLLFSGCGAGPAESQEAGLLSGSDCTAPETSESGELFGPVLLGEEEFLYVSGGTAESRMIGEVPALFDPNDPYMKIWEFSRVDLDGDGQEEVILFAVGVAGDMGGKLILHQMDGKVYGYLTDYRILVNLKTDGTYEYSDPTGTAEVGIAAVSAFSPTGYTEDKISYASGSWEGWEIFVAEHRPASEEEYMEAVSRQEKKPDAMWQDFTEEVLDALF